MLRPKTLHALELVRDGHTWRQAAQIAGVCQSAIARAMRLKRCPHCGQTINQTVGGNNG